MCPFTTSAQHSHCLMHTSFPNKQNSTAKGWGFGAQCLCVEPSFLLVFINKSTRTYIIFFFNCSKEYSYIYEHRPASRKPVPPRRASV
jgi:hypothetical protein